MGETVWDDDEHQNRPDDISCTRVVRRNISWGGLTDISDKSLHCLIDTGAVWFGPERHHGAGETFRDDDERSNRRDDGP